MQSSRRNRRESVGGFRLRNNATGLGTRADTRISAMVVMVREVLPHVPDELIAQVCCSRALISSYLHPIVGSLVRSED